VILLIPREAVEFVDQEIRNPIGTTKLDGTQELGAIRRFGRHTSLYEALQNLEAVPFGKFPAQTFLGFETCTFNLVV
jgi:hypothetical protein